MAEYYLIAQLPSLDAVNENMPLPITEERFLELCDRFLGKRAAAEIKSLTLAPALDQVKSSSVLVHAFNEGEKALRLALAKVRATKNKKPFDLGDIQVSDELIKVAEAAVEQESPLDAEKYLSDYRLSFLETLKPVDAFSEEFVFYYGLKLKLLLRIRRFDTAKGEAAYKNIYNTILGEDRLEDKQ